jgi:hypothetical protein
MRPSSGHRSGVSRGNRSSDSHETWQMHAPGHRPFGPLTLGTFRSARPEVACLLRPRSEMGRFSIRFSLNFAPPTRARSDLATAVSRPARRSGGGEPLDRAARSGGSHRPQPAQRAEKCRSRRPSFRCVMVTFCSGRHSSFYSRSAAEPQNGSFDGRSCTMNRYAEPPRFIRRTFDPGFHAVPRPLELRTHRAATIQRSGWPVGK